MDPFWADDTLSTLKRPNSTDDDENYLQGILNHFNKQEDQTAVMSQFYPGGRARAQVRNESGVSSGVILNQTYGSTVQDQTSQSPNSSVLTKSFSCLSASEKKRKIDKEYRERIKNQKADMELNLKNLTGENESLKTENQSLKKDNANMNQTLEDQTKEMERLRTDLLLLKHNYEKQNVLLQTLSGVLSDPLRLENEKLKDENASLRKNANFNSDLPQLLEENAKLRIDNKVLKVQNDALCGKIIGEYDKKSAIS